MEKRFEFLDKDHTSRLKGLSIILVLLSHLFVYVFGDLFGKWGIARLATPLGGIGASMFLFLSGYGIAKSASRGLSGFWKKRFFGVILPYLLIWFALLPANITGYTGIFDFVLDILAIKPMAEYFWYIGYQIFWYIVFYCVKRLGLPRWAYLSLLFGTGTLCFFALPGIYAEKAFAFALGVLFAELSALAEILKKPWVLSVSFVIGTLTLAAKQTAFVRGFGYIPYNTVELIIKTGFMFFFIGGFYYLVNLAPFVMPKLFYSLSYEIYLAHSAAAVFFYMILPINKYIAFAEFLLATAVFTALLWLFGKFVTPKLQGVKK